MFFRHIPRAAASSLQQLAGGFRAVASPSPLAAPALKSPAGLPAHLPAVRASSLGAHVAAAIATPGAAEETAHVSPPSRLASPVAGPSPAAPSLSDALSSAASRCGGAASWMPFAAGRGFSSGAAGKASRVVEVQTSADFDAALRGAPPTQLVVVDFTAGWCRPCQVIAPFLDKLSTTMPGVSFLKVDIEEEELQPTVDAAKIAAVPTFQFYKAGKLVSTFTGADANKLKDTIEVLQSA